MKLMYVNLTLLILISFILSNCGGAKTGTSYSVATIPCQRSGVVRFRFAPPDGTRAVLTRVTTRTKTFGRNKEQKDLVEVKSNLEFRSSRSGYMISERLTSSNMSRDGLLGQDPISELLQDMEIKYFVSVDGKISHIEGYDAVEQKAAATLSENLKAVLLPRLKEDRLVSEGIREWNHKIAGFVGREVVFGEVSDVEVPFALPSGERVTCLMQTTVRGLEECPVGKCVRIHTVYSSYRDETGNIISSNGNFVLEEARFIRGPQIFGTASRLIDPDTMLIYSDETTRTMKMTAEVAEQGVMPITLTETRSYTFEYQ